ncbi:MAG: bifunctional nuclease family protein [Turneriella sp.]|nr:bifunctional nuclease family protein [Turneriella sp.]
MLPATVNEIAITPMGYAVIVKPEQREKIIPIFIGPSEAYAISSVLQKEKPERPLTADLLRTVIEELQAKVSKVFINDFHGGTFYARVFLVGNFLKNGMRDLDARPSDAIALAVRFNAPIYVAEHVYDRTAIHINTLRDATGEALQTGENPDEILTAEEQEEFFEAILDELGEKKRSTQDSPENPVEKVRFLSRREVLQQMLKAALGKENYEEAARIRDELRAEGGAEE